MRSFRRFNSGLTARQQIDNYFTYFQTKNELRPLIYRQKNANTLLAMDLKDPVTKQQIKPREPIASVPKQLLTTYIKSIPQGSNEFFEWLKPWMQLTTRKKEIYQYFTSTHLQNILIQSCFIIGDYTRMVGYLYIQRPKFLNANHGSIFDVDHFYNTLLMCSLQRGSIMNFGGPEIAKKKVQQMWLNTVNKEQKLGLAPLLVECYAKQQGFDASGLMPELNNVPIVLPKLTNEMTPETFVQKNEPLYLICRTISQFSTDVPSEITSFINEYKTLTAKSDNSTDVYDKYVSSMTQIWTQKKEDRATRQNPVESPPKE
ncbi:hypothetical protein C6P45_005154 [Maudiozyma exigua]|uniref:Uncharacterized protein n=1 Tax=Maudiozyma exigua TaxID=34358 RepID=A0A9P6WBM7_MAUEX|nr:hypothetical protein C6P45_005154 [Kazachstania exigua]